MRRVRFRSPIHRPVKQERNKVDLIFSARSNADVQAAAKKIGPFGLIKSEKIALTGGHLKAEAK